MLLSPTTQSSCYRRGFLFLQSHLKPINQPSIPGTIFHLAPLARRGFLLLTQNESLASEATALEEVTSPLSVVQINCEQFIRSPDAQCPEASLATESMSPMTRASSIRATAFS